MRVFYQDFFLNPNGQWRYILGYEPAMMWPEDLTVYQAVLLRSKGVDLAPWVAKMTPRDRMILDGRRNVPPNVPGLRWSRAGFRWSGRLPSSRISAED